MHDQRIQAGRVSRGRTIVGLLHNERTSVSLLGAIQVWHSRSDSLQNRRIHVMRHSVVVQRLGRKSHMRCIYQPEARSNSKRPPNRGSWRLTTGKTPRLQSGQARNDIRPSTHRVSQCFRVIPTTEVDICLQGGDPVEPALS